MSSSSFAFKIIESNSKMEENISEENANNVAVPNWSSVHESMLPNLHNGQTSIVARYLRQNPNGDSVYRENPQSTGRIPTLPAESFLPSWDASLTTCNLQAIPNGIHLGINFETFG